MSVGIIDDDEKGLWKQIESWLKPQERDEVRRAIGHDLIERNEVQIP